ncbi:Rne/Rng family ribonuclease [Salinispora arenicola]|uniref:Rne/Rng family ribonuclease n=1 Tax=Salinispora arenicola TaxID=168697 RepID=UPI00037C7614|nr:Rne/Rng family ribonuclease [Salinispora arenicola]
MLANEPEGGERTGFHPDGETAEYHAGDGGAPAKTTSAEGGEAATGELAGSSPEPVGPATSEAAGAGVAELGEPAARVRKRATRKRATPVNRPEQTEAPIEAGTAAASGAGEAPQAEVLAPIAGDGEPATKSTRRRRKATTAKAAEESVTVSGAEETAADIVPPVKVTRTRRKKTAPAATEPAATTAEPDAVPAGPAPTAAEQESVPAGPAATAAEPVAGPAERKAESAPPASAAAGEVPPGAAVAGPEQQPLRPRVRSSAEPERPARRRAVLSAPTVLFMPPQPEEPAPARPAEERVAEGPVETSRRRRRGRRDVEPTTEVETGEPREADEEAREVRKPRETAEPRKTEEAEEPRETEEAEEPGETPEASEDEDETAGGRRRRRRGRRGRGRGKGSAEDVDDQEAEEVAAQAETAEAEDDEEEAEAGGGDGLTRRRRRRRRRGAGDVETAAEDGVPTVVKIREPRRTVDEVQGVTGSTRLEAKRQRRRDGREQRRTRPPILSEAEFLARREAVDRVMAVRQRGDRTQIAVLEDGVLVEHYVTRNSSTTMAGNVYLGKVQNVLPSMEAAFVDIGRGRNAVLYAGEVNWDATGLEGRARSIEQALKSGDSVLVQVTKDPIGHKGARLTSHVALSGRHLVYVPGGNTSGISRKLPDNERRRLRDALKKLVPEGAGVIVRTAAEGASEDELARDVKRLQAQWEDIQAKAGKGGAPVLLYEEPDLVIRVVRDLFNEDFRELVIEGEGAYDMVESYLSHVSPDLVARLRRHVGTVDVFTEYRIDEQILKGLDRKVFLPSGGHLVIDRTEAMTVVDVNTGKYTGAGGNLEETVTRNNLEAAEEIVRQLRLRDIGGIVVIDFIDMVLESNRELVLRRLTECLGRDRTKHQVTEITSLGLVQMTRKRIGAGLLEAFSETCDCCKGRGLIVHTEPVPEKPRTGGTGERVKAVASAETGTAPRRRTRKGSVAAERTSVEVVEGERDAGTTDTPGAAPTTPGADYYDTMGYDLSRYETETPAAPSVAASQPGDDPARLAAPDDPDAVGGDDGEEPETAAGRRRSRRGGSRRRTRP